MCRDGKIRIFEPQASAGGAEIAPKMEGGEVVPKKGARLVWVHDDQYLLVTGFTK